MRILTPRARAEARPRKPCADNLAPVPPWNCFATDSVIVPALTRRKPQRGGIGPALASSPKRIMGEGLMATAAWQCVACEALARGRFQAANVSVVGANQQAIGVRFIHNDPASTQRFAAPDAQQNSP